MTFEAADLSPVLDAVAGWPAFAGEPLKMGDDDRDWKPSRAWLATLRSAGHGYARFTPNKPAGRLAKVTIAAGLVVGAVAPDMFGSVDELVALLQEIPFEVCSIGTLYPDEWAASKERSTFGFANTHVTLGFGCAFRGPGHDRLVSRRWLEHGPWRLHRGADDLSLVQFHDLDADPLTALAQAIPGHRRMGISDQGGFIQGPSAAGKGIGYVAAEKLPEGLYHAEDRTLEVVVPTGRAVPQGEMQDACAYRRAKRDDRSTPIAQVAYVFMTEKEARAHLREMWLRELQVWTVEGGAKRRLDLELERTTP
jgi:hypothetical protein